MAIESWDHRLARILVKPLVSTPVHPNHLTALSFVFGLAAAVLFATGDPARANPAAGLCNPIILVLRIRTERRHGAKSVAHPRYGGVEIEDLIYLIGPITWLGWLEYFFLAYGIGSFGYFAWSVWQAMRSRP